MSVDVRLSQTPLFQRGKPLSFRFNGTTVRAYEGETVGAALHAAGVRIFNRSIKYHRPRGLFCVSGNCPNCLMQVDSVPNVRACQEPVRAGMEVRTQTGWPSPRFDIFALLDTFGFLFPLGFQYRYFIRPSWLYHWWERLLRHMSGHGVLSSPSPSWREATKIAEETDIVIVGGGPAGLSAAIAAASVGARTTLIDEGPALGGSLRADTARYQAPQECAGRQGFEIGDTLSCKAREQATLRVYAPATAFGYYGDGVIGVRAGDTLVRLTTRRLIVATGAYENPLVVDDWDRPGVFLATGVQKMLHLWGMRPGKAAVVVSTNNFGPEVAAQLLEAGIEIKAVADSRVRLDETSPAVDVLRQQGTPLLTSHTLKSIVGSSHVRGVILARLNAQGHRVTGADLRLPCDTVVLAPGFFPANELAFHATYKGSYILETAGNLARIPHRREDMSVEDGLYVAGNAAGISDLEQTLLEGEIAGFSAAISLGFGGGDAAAKWEQAQRALAAKREG